MVEESPLDKAAESEAAALAKIWLAPQSDIDLAHREAQVLVDAAATRGEPRLASLERGLALFHRFIARVALPPGTHEAALDLLQTSQGPETWWRARYLAEATWGMSVIHQSDVRGRALDMLLRQVERPGQRQPAAELACCDTALASLLSVTGDFDRALQAGLRAQQALDGEGHELLQAQLTLTMSFVFLSVGDLEAASGLFERLQSREDDQSKGAIVMAYNLLLALLLQRRLDQAAALLEKRPWLFQDALLDSVPPLADLLASVRQLQGRHDEARRLLDRAQPDLARLPSPLRANRAWLRAGALSGLGRHSEALEVLRAELSFALPMTPMNATQWYRALADACEASGDLAGALEALKRSQSSCVTWVGDSVRARLAVLHRLAPEGEPDLQSRRVAEVMQAVTERENELADREAAIVRQRRFLAHVVHELRNPVWAVVGMTSLITMDSLDERQCEYLGLAQSSAHLLMTLCNNVLDMAKIEAGRFELNPGPVDIGSVVGQMSQMLQPMVHARKVELQWQTDPALPQWVQGDVLRLQQVLMNLVSNAAKFTKQGRIDIHASWTSPGQAQDGEMRIEVRDTGPGISPLELDKLFTEFVQLGPANPQEQRGSGLGLALSRSLVELMGGQMGAQSQPGRGSTFWFTLPLRVLEAGPEGDEDPPDAARR